MFLQAYFNRPQIRMPSLKRFLTLLFDEHTDLTSIIARDSALNATCSDPNILSPFYPVSRVNHHPRSSNSLS